MGDFQRPGRLWLRGLLTAETLLQMDAMSPADGLAGARAPSLAVFNAPEVIDALQPLLPGAFATRAVAFSKSDGRNWSVPWHQDRVIAVRDRRDVPGYRNWTEKEGVWHCEPPAGVLRNMLFGRFFLDSTGPRNGGMEIALGSHLRGVIPSDQASIVAAACSKEIETAERGDVLVMSMLMLHRSVPSQSGAPRRVLRVDYANTALPHALRWFGA